MMTRPRSNQDPFRLFAALLAGSTLLLGTAAFGWAQQYGPRLFSGMRWRLIGPFRGGRTLAVAGIPEDPNVYYFGAVGGGVWKTTDGGIVWKPIFDRAPIASVGAVAIAPTDPKVIYVGTGEGDMRSDISVGDGVYKSTDGGATWQHIGLESTRAIGRILVDPHNPEIVLVAALGHPYGPNSERGVFRSTDGGRTWQKVLYKDENTGAIDLCYAPENSQVIYAALWQTRRPPWSTYPPIDGPGSGLYRSIDGGLSWSAISSHGWPSGPVGRIGVAVARGEQGRRVFALVDTLDSKRRGLYRSDDSGVTWQHVSSDPRIDGRAWYFSGVIVDPNHSDTVYVANTALYRSTDGGRSFFPIKGAPGGDDYHDLWIDPRDSRRMIVSSDQGTVISVDGGETWSSWYNQPTAQFYHVATDNDFPYHVYGAQQDSGSVDIASGTDSAGITFRDWRPSAGGESGYLAPDPLDSKITYGGEFGGSVSKLMELSHQIQNVSPVVGRLDGLSAAGGCRPGTGHRFTWTSPLVFSPKNPRVLYLGSEVLLRTTDGGISWQAVSPDLTRPAAGPQPSAGAVPSDFEKLTGCGVIYAVAPSPLDEGQIWVGTDDGLIQLTEDGGRSWRNVTPPDLGPWSKVSLIDASHFDPGTAYAAIDRHRLDDYRPLIYRTHDDGRTWQAIGAGLPETACVHAVREDPVRKGLLYAGTETGVFVSFDDGEHWQSLQLNLPPAPIHDLVVHGDDLVVATHGRSFWILDDLTPLRQLDAQRAASEVVLYQPENAVRVRGHGFDETPLPPEVPSGENPPNGAIIDYYLKSAHRDVKLEILDAKGQLVREYSSLEKPPEPRRPPVITAHWIHPPALLPGNAGMNRFVWDLRYGSPPSLAKAGPESFFSSRGPMALPGSYQVRLTVGERTYTQSLNVVPDPRVKVSSVDLVAQLNLEQRILNDLARANRASNEIGKLHSDLAAAKKGLESRAEARAAGKALTDLDGQAATILRGTPAAVWEPRVHGGASTNAQPRPGLERVGSMLAQILAAVDSADSAPTVQSKEAFERADRGLNDALAEWSELKTKSLPALNDLLRQNGAPGIAIPAGN
ncbi:MAG TPA: hypothetical protein VG204_21070 [Terriglobia bacterium]|nr:hypothetical protein [Terriglobia bacterium]